MLSLKIGNTFVDTSDADIPVVLRSPLFPSEDGHVEGSFIFNFSIPLTDDLKKELGFAHRPSIKGRPRYRHPFTLRFKQLHYSGTATITELDKHNVEVSMPVDTGDLAYVMKELTLKDLEINETIPFEPKISYCDLGSRYNHLHTQQGIFVHDVWIEPNTIRIDTLNAYDNHNKFWTIPYSGSFNISVVINSGFGKITALGNTYDAGENRVFRLYRNSEVLFTQHITEDSYLHKGVYTLNEGDIILFSARTVSVSMAGTVMHHLNLYILPGTTVSIDDGNTPFQDVIGQCFPDTAFAVFPVKNPGILDNIPESLFRVDFNDLKDCHAQFASVANFFVDYSFPHASGKFPWVMSGSANDQYYALLNMFMPAPYVAFIIRKLFSFINYTIQDNVFESDELKRLVYLSNNFINNYVHDPGPVKLIDFVPDETLGEFLRNLCKNLGIAFNVKSSTRTVRFKFLDDIMADISSVSFSEDVIGYPTLTSEFFSGFTLKMKELSCQYIQDHFKPLDGLEVKGNVNTYRLLPASASVNDCYYVVNLKAWFIWQYDPDKGEYAWVFHSIDYASELTENSNQSKDETLNLDLPVSIPAMYFFDPESTEYSMAGMDNTIGMPFSRRWIIPGFFLPGNFKNLPAAYQSDQHSCLLFHHGLVNSSPFGIYPYASNDVYDMNGNKLPGSDLSLRPDGEHGLFKKKFERFIRWRLESPGVYRFYKRLTPLQISQLDWFRWHEIRGVSYLLKEVRLNIYNDHISPAELLAHRR